MLLVAMPAPGEAAMQPCSDSELNSDPRQKRSGLHEPSVPPSESSEEPSSAMRAVVSGFRAGLLSQRGLALLSDGSPAAAEAGQAARTGERLGLYESSGPPLRRRGSLPLRCVR